MYREFRARNRRVFQGWVWSLVNLSFEDEGREETRHWFLARVEWWSHASEWSLIG